MTLGYKNFGGWVLLAAVHAACNPLPAEVGTASGTTGVDNSTTSGPGVMTADSTGDSGEPTDTDDPNAPVCGDGVIEGDEECDLGPDNGMGDYCRDNCVSNVCGDDYLGPGELCDDGNLSNEDDCSDQCGPTTCGDGALQRLEECDEGPNNSNTGACLENCAMASCGDQNIWEGMETCDADNIDGQTCATQGFDTGELVCLPNCMGFDTSSCAACGNSMIEANEDCDTAELDGFECATLPGFDDGTLACDAQCAFDTTGCTECGDNMVEGDEQCEAGMVGSDCANEVPGTNFGTLGCNAAMCTFNTSDCTECGNNSVEGSEICDSVEFGAETCASQAPNGEPSSGGFLLCTDCAAIDNSNCVYCGDNVVEQSEVCEAGDLNGATCASVQMGPEWGGVLGCGSDCTDYDVSGCCITTGSPCTVGDPCCDGNECLENGMSGTFTCQ